MTDRFGFVHGFVYARDRLYFGVVDIELEEQDVYHGYVFRWHQGQWGNWVVDNRIYALGVYDLGVERTSMAMGPEGRIQIGDASGFHEDQVDADGDGPTRRRPLTALRRIGSYLYVVGMARMAYRRPLKMARWERIDAELRVPASSLEITGLLAVDGFKDDDIYAVGFHGQIWHFNGKRWRQLESPTNLKLECVRCAPDGQVYVAGSKGFLLRGRANSWEVLVQDLTEDTFWGMEYAFDSLYLSSASGHLFVAADGRLSAVKTGLGRITTRTLHFADSVLLSTGARDLCIFDGNRWARLDLPIRASPP